MTTTDTCPVTIHLQAETVEASSRLFDIGEANIDLAPWVMTVDTETLKTVLDNKAKLEDVIGRYLEPIHDGPFFVDDEHARDAVCRFLDVPVFQDITSDDQENARQRTGFYDTTPEVTDDTFEIDMIVAGVTQDGQPAFKHVPLTVDREDLAAKTHHEKAIEAARDEDFDPRVAFDETDAAGGLKRDTIPDFNPDPAREWRLRRLRDGLKPVETPSAFHGYQPSQRFS